MSSWALSLGKATIGEAESIIWLHGESAHDDPDVAGEQCDMAVLLADARFKPQMQFFMLLGLQENPDEVQFVKPEVYPFTLELSTTASRLSRRYKALHEVSSDKLGLRLARMQMTWTFIPLLWEECVGENLMKFKVTGHGDEVNIAKKKRQKKKVSAGIGAIDDLFGDPYEIGQNLAGGGGAPEPEDAESSDGGGEDNVGEDVVAAAADPDDADAEMCEDLDPLDIEAAADELLDPEENVAVAEAAARDDMADVEAGGDDALGDERDEEDRALEMAEAEAHGLPSELAERAVVDALGVIRLDEPPWDRFDKIGRITNSPVHKPPERQNVSCRCYIHRNCVTPAKVRHRITDAKLREWLFSGQVPDRDASRDDKVAMGVAHKALFPGFLA